MQKGINDMRILLPVAAPIRYNPAYFLEKAFQQLGHKAKVLDQAELYTKTVKDADLFVGVDSGGPLNIPDELLSKSIMWFIDSRRNHNPEIRNPDDDTTGLRILNGGGHVLQAQVEDAERFNKLAGGNEKFWRVFYMPIGVDTTVWSEKPVKRNPTWPCAFVGNCYDTKRLDILNDLVARKLLHWPGIEGAIMEQGAEVYRDAVCGLNVPSWLDTPECYDVNMRVFEIMSCGKPLITNFVKGLFELGFEEGVHYLSYGEISDIPKLINYFVGNIPSAMEMGAKSRSYIERYHTYKHRAQFILDLWEANFV